MTTRPLTAAPHVTPQDFGEGFLWGTTTAAYQIEGAVSEDGRGESIWDRFCATPGKVRNGESGAVACDFYHRYPEDIALLREPGRETRSGSPSRGRACCRTGAGPSTNGASTSTNRLVDALLAAGIEPLVTLYHWDLPVALEGRRAAGRNARRWRPFCEYAEVVAHRLGDRVKKDHAQRAWVISWLGYGRGVHAPGAPRCPMPSRRHTTFCSRTASPSSRSCASRRAHASGSRSTSSRSIPQPTRTPTPTPRTSSTVERNRWFLDPLFRGQYPRTPSRDCRSTRDSSTTATSRRWRLRSTSSASTTTSLAS